MEILILRPFYDTHVTFIEDQISSGGIELEAFET